MSNKIYKLNDVVGHGNIIRWFDSAMKRDRLPQVVMLTGPAGVGKTTIAKIVACEIAYMNSQSKLEDAKKSVIGEDKSTDAVRLYNMSNLKSQDAVQGVKSDLSVGFSSTGRKVIIMDEAHGMSEEAQDSLLTVFESLPLHVYIIVCTTELNSFREAFLSRCILRHLSNLSEAEMRTLLKRRIDENGLKFELSLQMILTLIINYAGREPRRAINLLDSFEPNSVVTARDLESFMSVHEGTQLVRLIQILYTGSIMEGLSFIKDMEITPSITTTILELLRIAEGAQATIIDKGATLLVRQLVSEHGLNSLLGFAIDLSTASRLSRNKLSGLFLKWCKHTEEVFAEPERRTNEQIQLNDLSVMSNMIESHEVYAQTQESGEVPMLSLEQLLADSEVLND